MKLHSGVHWSDQVLTPETLAVLDPEQLVDIAKLHSLRRWGLSSAGLVRWALLQWPKSEPYSDYMPADSGDLGRCDAIVAASPEWLKVRMVDQLEAFHRYVEATSR